MSPTTFLRIAAIITLLYFAGHTSGYPWTPAVGSGEMPVIEAMKTHSFDVIGTMRTYWDFYVGFGLINGLLMLMLAIMLWQLGAIAKTDAVRVRPIVATLLIGFIVNLVLAIQYFFVIPIVMSAAIVICLAGAFVTSGRKLSE